MPQVMHGEYVKKGQLVGFIADALNGVTKEELFSPVDGMVFTLREYPVVNEGSLIARVVGDIGAKRKKTEALKAGDAVKTKTASAAEKDIPVKMKRTSPAKKGGGMR